MHNSEECEVTAICFQHIDNNQIELLSSYGADKIICCRSNLLNIYEKIEALAYLINQKQPQLLIFTASSEGKIIAASTSTIVGAGLTAECIDLQYESNGKYIFSRTALSSSVIANIVCINTNIQMCTVGKNVFSSCCSPNRPLAEIAEIEKSGNIIPNESRNILSLLNQAPLNDNVDFPIETAEIVFAFGRGLNQSKGIKELKVLASKVHAEIGGSRAVVEEGLLPKSRQIGQSGISISPKLYMAFGISGASQHIVGIKNSSCIVAVNSDPYAPIFEVANYCVVDDCLNIITELNKLTLEGLTATL